MDLGIRGETALVLAGTRGIGFGCARALVTAGVEVAINGVDPARGAAAAEQLGPAARFIAADLTRPAERARLHTEAAERLGGISILVTNAGWTPYGPLMEMPTAAWGDAIEQIMLAALDLMQRCLPGMVAAGFGRVVNIGSISVGRPTAGRAQTVALKAGLMGALVAAAQEVAEKGVTVNNIVAGAFDTELLRAIAREFVTDQDVGADEAFARYARARPMGRVGGIEEIGDLCAFLCSRRAAYITGQSVGIDGGEVPSLQ